MKRKTGLNGCVYNFSVGSKAFVISGIINFRKHVTKKHKMK